jgi:hypothetical protein
MTATRDPWVPERKLTIPSASAISAPHSRKPARFISVQMIGPVQRMFWRAWLQRQRVERGLRRKSQSTTGSRLPPASTRSATVRMVWGVVLGVRRPRVSP